MSKELKERLDRCNLNAIIFNQREALRTLEEDKANLKKQNKKLQEQLKEAQNLIIYTANGHDHLFAEIQCEDYMHKYHLPKWGVK